MVGQLLGLLDQRVDDGLRVAARDLGEHHVPGLPFDQRDDVAVLRAAQQVAFPMAGDRSILDAGRPLADGDGIRDASSSVGLGRGVA